MLAQWRPPRLRQRRALCLKGAHLQLLEVPPDGLRPGAAGGETLDHSKDEINVPIALSAFRDKTLDHSQGKGSGLSNRVL